MFTEAGEPYLIIRDAGIEIKIFLNTPTKIITGIDLESFLKQLLYQMIYKRAILKRTDLFSNGILTV